MRKSATLGRRDRLPHLRSLPAALVWAVASIHPGAAQQAGPVSAKLVEVVSKPLEGTTELPGELRPYRSVDIYAKVSGFVRSVSVDRGSHVRKGAALATITAPEMDARIAEARARMVSIESQRSEAESKLAALRSTFERLKEAAKTPGAVAGHDIELAEKAMDAERSRVVSVEKTIEAAKASVAALEDLRNYLRVAAEFDGVITERFAHEGSLVGPESKGATPLFRLEQIDRLRLVVAVPESLAGGIRIGARVEFTVSTYPSRKFSGVVARPALSVDPKTRTMPVELDVNNVGGRLAPGMYAEVIWPMARGRSSLLVPATAIKSTTERIFVIRVVNGLAEWVDVRRGAPQKDLVEVMGNLKPGDKILQRATDEVRPGTKIAAQ
ncbi:MAG: efflux RND transporter periplasmic adaptor subunit [Bryobacteraceae bacterium]